MQRELSKEEIDRHHQMYLEGCLLLKPNMFLDADMPQQALTACKEQLQRARLCFEKALGIIPDDWSSMWSLGKIHQLLGEHPQSLSWFRMAVGVIPSNPDVLTEAGIEAVEMGNIEEAVNYLRAAASINPDNAGCHANLAMALLINGSLQEAKSAIKTSLSLEPYDSLVQGISDTIDRVIVGSLPQPRSIKDIF